MYMKLAQIILIILAVTAIYVLLQIVQQTNRSSSDIVYVSNPSTPYWGQGPVWRGPRPGRRRGRGRGGPRRLWL